MTTYSTSYIFQKKNISFSKNVN